MEKENSWLDEQIRASQQERVRESAQSMVSTASNPQDHAANNAGYFKVVPNEVTSHKRGVAQGTQPSVEYLIDPATGRRIPVPFGSTQNAEPSEAFSMMREISAHYGIPLDVLSGKHVLDKWRNFRDKYFVTPTWLPGQYWLKTAPKKGQPRRYCVMAYRRRSRYSRRPVRRGRRIRRGRRLRTPRVQRIGYRF